MQLSIIGNAAIIYWDCSKKKIGNAAINCGGCSSKELEMQQ